MGSSEESVRINIRAFIEKWQTELQVEEEKQYATYENESAYIQHNSNMESQILSELEVVCGVDTLNCPEEPKTAERLLMLDPGSIQDVELSSLKYQKDDVAKRNSNTKYKCAWNRLSTYRDRKTPWLHQELSAAGVAQNWKMPEALISVQIHRPYRKGQLRDAAEQEIQLVSGQRLTALRDKIFCLSDHMVPGDCSDLPNVKPEIKTKDVYKSGFFFIEGVFYNDLRDPSQNDASKVIRDWSIKEGLGQYDCHSMDDVCLRDLTVTLGQPYLYQHQGQCEHVIIFSDIRSVSSEDCRDITKYPITTYQTFPKKILCRVCMMYRSKWVTKNSPQSPEDPCFYCNTCFQAFHYDVYGKKLFDFRAYHYPETV